MFSSFNKLGALLQNKPINATVIIGSNTNIWITLGSTYYNGTNGSILTIVKDISRNSIYVGGTFTTVQDVSNTVAISAKNIAGWDISNQTWRQFGNTSYNGTNTTVRALALDSSNSLLYVGGAFTTVQDVSNTVALSAKYIASWDISNQTWRQFGNTTYNGTNAAVSTLALDSSNRQLYIGGSFTTVQDVSNTVALSANRIATWDISNQTWIQLGNSFGNGTNNDINAFTLDSSNQQLYVGGAFTTVNLAKPISQYISSYNYSLNKQSNISLIGSAYTNGTVNAIIKDVSRNTVYVGGTFTIIYDNSNSLGISARNIARWDISNQTWMQFGNTTYNGANNTIWALALDSSGGQLYVGGAFTSVQDTINTGGLSASRIAAWDIVNRTWNPIGTVTYNGTNNIVYALAVDSLNKQLYVGGSFTSAPLPSNGFTLTTKSIARWDIVAKGWNYLGSAAYNGTNGQVNAIALDSVNNQLYVAGAFSTVQDINLGATALPANNIVRWNISTARWSQLGNATYNGANTTVSVLSLNKSTGELYIGGTFTVVYDTGNTGGLLANYVARWNISSLRWVQFGNSSSNGTNNGVFALALDSSNNQLYVGGSFTTVQDTINTIALSANNITRWDILNQTWKQVSNSVNNGTNNQVSAIAIDVSTPVVYLGGSFTSINSSLLSTNRIARWNISNKTWTQFGNDSYNGTNNNVNALALDIYKRQIYVGGLFTTVQDVSNTVALSAKYIAGWDISNQKWNLLGNSVYNGTGGPVNVLKLNTSNNILYTGGEFYYYNTISNPISQYISSYDYLSNQQSNISFSGSAYTNGQVNTIIKDLSMNIIYVGGTFTLVYDNSNSLGISANNIARWNISNRTWSQFGNTLYNGTNTTVSALALDSSNRQLYVGGSFITVQDTINTVALSANYVARWDILNQTWIQFGNTTYNGTNATVSTLSLDSSNRQLYVGGSFTTVQDTKNTVALSTNRIARWDIPNQIWRQIGNITGNGTNAAVNTFSLNSSNGQLYVGGAFTSISLGTSQYISSYNYLSNQQSTISYSGSAYTNGLVNTIVKDISMNIIYVGGTFTLVYDNSNSLGITANNIARWDISNQIWRQFGNTTYNGTNNTINAFALDSSNQQLYVGGAFTTVQDTINTVALSANNIARWDISNQIWRQFGNTAYNGTNNTINAFALDSSNQQLYVGGAFTTVQDTINTVALSAKNVARWDISNQTWRQFGNTTYNGTSGTVSTLSLDISNRQLYVGGNFILVQDVSNTVALSAKYIARWDISNQTWRQFGNTTNNGTNNEVRAIALDSSNQQLFVGGAFTTVSLPKSLSQYIGSYNYSLNRQSNISSIGYAFTSGAVYAIIKDISSNSIYVGGTFTLVYDNSYSSGISARNIARWDITNQRWYQLGNSLYNGTSSTVSALALDSSNGQLYVGGSFITVLDTINTVALSAKYVARWDIPNQTWRQFGNTTYNGTNTSVNAFALDISNQQVYVGGVFTTVQDTINTVALSAKYVARWDIPNQTWRQFGNTTYNGTNNTVTSLALDSSNGQLYVGGLFTTVQDTINTVALSAKYVAGWDILNQRWRQFGNTTYNGTNNSVRVITLDSSNNQLYVGGTFITVQDTINTVALSANYVARWDISNQTWRQFGNNSNGTANIVYTLALDSSNQQLFVGGNFTTVNDAINISLSANYVARWDILNQTWKQFGTAISNGTNNTVYAFALDGLTPNVYLGGVFTLTNASLISANYVARWDIPNQTWTQFGNDSYNGTNNSVYTFALDSSNRQLYVGGQFLTVQDISNTVALSANYAVIWDLSNKTWRQIGNNTANGTNNIVNALAFDNKNSVVYLGGYFTATNPSTLSANYVASLNVSNQTWGKYGNGTNNNVNALIVDSSNQQLFVGGVFQTVSLPKSLSQYISSYNYLFNKQSNITSIGSAYTNGIVYTIVKDISRNTIYVGGAFTIVYDNSNSSGLSANYVARWDISNQTWRQFGNNTYNGTNASVRALEVDISNGQIYVGGQFTTVQDTTNVPALSVKYVARWDISNQTWSQFGNNTYNGTNNAVLAIALDNSNSQLYVGGQFSTVQDSSNTTAISAKYVARWDISNKTWRQLGNTTYNGTNSFVYALVLDSSNSQVYVGGGFTTVQDVSNTVALSAKCVARWDISNKTWRQFGNTTYNGTNTTVYALALDSSNNQLYVGGAFTTVQDVSNSTALSANRVARWDISNQTWNQFGNNNYNGTNNNVNAFTLDISNRQLYVGGAFTTVQDVSNTAALSANYAVRWDISNQIWKQFENTLNNGTNNVVNTLALDNQSSNVYLGGTFTEINTNLLSTNRIARLDISNQTWNQFGNNSYNGTNDNVNAFTLDISNQQLYVGGAFTTVQDVSNSTSLSANKVARWDISNQIWKQFGDNLYNGTNNTVQALELDNSNSKVIVGGAFTEIRRNNPNSAKNIAKWNISTKTWSQVGDIYYNGTNNTVRSLEINDTYKQLYVGGQFTQVYDLCNISLNANSIAAINN